MSRNYALASVLGAALVSGVGACGGYASYVESDTALGRVVVYRNGIAYYERRATVQGDALALEVPRDKVNDFLKSLNVTDAETGEALPISYPTRGATRGSTVEMRVKLPPGASRQVVLTYITASPSWKPSYRLTVEKGGKVDIQGWAIVDNTSGEDWKGVRVGVGSSSALSFRYDLRSVRKVRRETLQAERRFAAAPPTGGATYGGAPEGEEVMDLADADIPKPAGAPGSVYNAPAPPPMPAPTAAEASPTRIAATPSRPRSKPRRARRSKRKRRSGVGGLGTKGVGSGGGGGALSTRRGHGASKVAESGARVRMDDATRDARVQQQRARRLAEERLRKQRQAEEKLARLAAELRRSHRDVVIEGYAGPGEGNPQGAGLRRANTLRNQLIQRGVAPGQVRAVSKGYVPGRPAGVRLVADKRAASAQGGGDDTPVGESHFESQVKLDVPRGTSALVSVVQAQTEGERVYLYDAESARGNARFAFNAVRFRNPTRSTLETGPVTVYGEAGFVGEGLVEPVPPGATALVPYALDRQIVVDRAGDTRDDIERIVSVERGILTAEVRHSRVAKLEITNRMRTPAKVFVRHTVPKGWKLASAPKLYERQGEAYLFEVDIPGNTTRTYEIREETPIQRSVDLRTGIGVELVRAYVTSPGANARFAKQMAKVLADYDAMDRHRLEIESLRDRMGEYRARMDELHTQIMSLKSVKTGGALMRHLQKKMTEISGRVQKATLAIVEHQQQLMLAKIRFQDAIAELTLAEAQPSRADGAPKES